MQALPKEIPEHRTEPAQGSRIASLWSASQTSTEGGTYQCREAVLSRRFYRFWRVRDFWGNTGSTSTAFTASLLFIILLVRA